MIRPEDQVCRGDGDEDPERQDAADDQGHAHDHLAGPVGDGVEHRTEVRDLTELSRGETVDPVGGAQGDEHDERPEVLVPHQNEQNEQGHEQDETGERDRVRHVQNPLALRVRCRGVHTLRVTGACRSPEWPVQTVSVGPMTDLRRPDPSAAPDSM